MRRDVFDESDPLVVEFGAGKAYLSSMIADCTKARSFVLLDNQAFKFKVISIQGRNKRLKSKL